MSARVAAIVIGARGDHRLTEALASVAWAEQRVVADPGGRLVGRSFPEGVVRARDPLAAATAPWVLLLREQETVPPEVATAIATATAAPEAGIAYRIGQAVSTPEATFRLRGAPIRLAPRVGARIAAGRTLGVELRTSVRRVARLPGLLAMRAAPSLAVALEELDAESATLAAILRAADVRPGFADLALAPAGPAARSLLAAGPLRAACARWTLGAFAAFGVVTTYAKLWELHRAEAASPR